MGGLTAWHGKNHVPAALPMVTSAGCVLYALAASPAVAQRAHLVVQLDLRRAAQVEVDAGAVAADGVGGVV